MNRRFPLPGFLSVLAVASIGFWLAACSGGESGTGFGGSHPKVAVGVISGFGSVFVNGVEYDTSLAQIYCNETPGSEEELAIGMLVTVVGSTDRAQTAGSAAAIYYQSKVRGIITQAYANGLVILGQAVAYDDETVFESQVDSISRLEDVPVDASVEVSGYRTGDNSLQATHVVLLHSGYSPGDQEIVHGVLTTPMSGGKFSIGDLVVVADSATVFRGMGSEHLQPGTKVKVTSRRPLVNQELMADTIERDSTLAIAGNAVEIEGIVTGSIAQAHEFQLNGYTVFYSGQTEFRNGDAADLIDNAKLEVEGVLLSDAQIEATDIEFRVKARLKLTAPITAVYASAKQVNAGGVLFDLDSRTLLKDSDRTTRIKRFSLADLSPEDRVEIKAFYDKQTGENRATQLRRLTARSPDTSFEIRGVLEQLTAEQAVVSGIALDRARITQPQSFPPVGEIVTITGTAPLINP